jgi:uncharacterized protein (DUF302 family)
MLFEVSTRKDYATIDADLRAAVARHQFGVLGVHDLKQAMNNKGVDFDREVFVYEVCNPHKAKAVLSANGAISTALPCRISVYRQGSEFRLATMLPTAMMSAFGDESLQDVAREVEVALLAIMNEAV